MKTCPECEKAGLREGREQRTMKVGGVTFAADLPVRRCSACDAAFVSGPAMLEFEAAVAREVADMEPSGDGFRFLRKALGLRAADLAAALDVAPETVSRWENDQRPVDRATFTLLGMLVRAGEQERKTLLERLRHRRPKRAKRRVKIDLKSAAT